MIDCIGFDTTIQLLVDGELTGEELERARAHLATCEACAKKFAEEEKLSKLVRSSYIPETASAPLRDRVLQKTRPAWAAASQEGAGAPVAAPISLVRPRLISIARPRQKLVFLAASILIGFLLFPLVRNRMRANSFIDVAISQDQNLSAHLMPLDVQSDSPKEVSTWFANRVAFPFRLPSAGIASDEHAKYTLAGGRLVNFKGENAALIDFRIAEKRISLLIASDKAAKAEGGSVTISGGVVLHRKQRKEQNVVTWDNKGLTYALIFPSTLSHPGKCMACHQSSATETQLENDALRLTKPNLFRPHSKPSEVRVERLKRSRSRELVPASCSSSANLCDSYPIFPSLLPSLDLQAMEPNQEIARR